MVVVDLGKESPNGEMKRSSSFAGTVDIGYALAEPKEAPYQGWQSLALPATYGALAGMAMSVRQPWACTVCGLVFLVVAGPTALSSTYTIWNWTALIGQICDAVIRPSAPPRLLPYLVVNSWAIFTSFNIMIVAHPSHFVELAKRLESGMPYFHFMNTLGHFVPGVVGLAWYSLLDSEARTAACAWTSLAPLEVASLCFHFAWAARVAGGLKLDNARAPRPKAPIGLGTGTHRARPAGLPEATSVPVVLRLGHGHPHPPPRRHLRPRHLRQPGRPDHRRQRALLPPRRLGEAQGPLSTNVLMCEGSRTSTRSLARLPRLRRPGAGARSRTHGVVQRGGAARRPLWQRHS